MPSLDAAPVELLDPNKLSADGTVSLSCYAVSKDGKYMAYGLNTSGSDWIDWHVKDVATGIDLPDQLKWSKFSGASWTKDSKGFFYSRYDEPDEKTQLQTANYFQKLYYHAVGTEQAKDTLVYERKDQKEWGFGGDVTDDGQYLIIDVSHGTDPKNRIFYRALKDGTRPARRWSNCCPDADAHYDFVGNDGATFYFLTDHDAPRGRLVALDVEPKPKVDACAKSCRRRRKRCRAVNFVGGRFVASYLKDAHSQVKVFDKDGKLRRRGAVPGSGHGQRLRRASRTIPETFLRVHELHRAADHLSLRRADRREPQGLRAEGALRSGGIHDRTGVLPEPGRHARPDVHLLQERAQEERCKSDAALRLRRDSAFR